MVLQPVSVEYGIEAMMMLIRFFDGRSQEAILLASSGQTLRVALRDSEDSTEFRFDRGVWLSENDDPVRIEGVWPEAGPSGHWVN
jgi:hypothetical protein